MHLLRGGAATPHLGDFVAAPARSMVVQQSICDEQPSTRSAAAGAHVSADSDVGGELTITMPQRPRACADRLQTSFVGARGPAVAAGSTPELRGCMGACVAQALAVRLPRQILCGAASHEHVLHMRTTAGWSDSTAKTCWRWSTGGTLGSRCMSAVQCTCTP